VGSPKINLVDAHFEPDAHGGVLHAAAAKLAAPLHLQPVFTEGTRDFVLGIRPENLTPTDADGASIRGKLTDIEPLGLNSVLTVSNDAAELRVHVQSAATRGLSIGQAIGLTPVNTNQLLAFDQTSGQLLNSQEAP
jgi:ABC-type sugar transport system ATPase subunit